MSYKSDPDNVLLMLIDNRPGNELESTLQHVASELHELLRLLAFSGAALILRVPFILYNGQEYLMKGSRQC